MFGSLSWKNLWRNKLRSLITIASVFFAVVLSVVLTAIQKGAMQNLVKDVVGFYSSYIQVHKKGYYDNQTLDNMLVVSDSLIDAVKQQKNVVLVSPRIETFVLASTGQNTQGCMLTGIMPSKESELIKLRQKVKSGNYMSDDEPGVMISEGLANKLGLQVGDTVMLLGQGYQGATAAGRYPVRTLLTFGSPQLNDRLMFMPVKQAQSLLSAGNMATTLVVSVDDTKSLQQIQSGIEHHLPAGYEVINWQQMQPEIDQMVKTKEGSEIIIVLLLYALVSFGIFATLLMMMAEREYELGMLFAIGMKKAQLARMVALESVFVSAIGCVAGLVVSIPLVFYLHVHPITFGGQMKKMYENFGFEAVIPASITPSIFYEQVIIIGLVSLALSAYPMYKIFSMNALKAMRK
ncbi:MAG TPA: FtsX-like permease family protein [Chitinophagales bacterium]|nr:FtsX-like permease family protein [Chitinophagales bacterium]